jgi:glycosyltransferase involved in cell wall biosynthesis
MPIDRPLKVTVASIGRCHMFDLARQIKALGQDVRLLTGYPQPKVDPELRPVAKTHPMWVYAEHLCLRLPWDPPGWLLYQQARDFGEWAAKRLIKEQPDIFDALDGGGLEAGRMLRDRGSVWICNRGAAHVVTQKLLLEEEHRRWGIPIPRHYFGSDHMDRSLAEYGGADAIMTPSRFVARSFVEQGLPPEKVYVCPYGVDLSMFSPQPKLDKKFRVIFAGTQSIQKGVGYLLDGLRPLVQGRGVEIWFVGQIASDAQEIMRRNASILVHKGVQPRSQLASLYSQASVLVLPSVQDGFGLVMAQAMACGVPVIATRNTGAEDLFTADGVEGFIVPIRNPLVLRQKVEWMLDNPELRDRMAEAALLRVKRLGGWRSYGLRCLKIYRNLLLQKNAEGSHEDLAWSASQ